VRFENEGKEKKRKQGIMKKAKVKANIVKTPQGKTPVQLLTLSYKRARAIQHLQKINKVTLKR